MAVVMHPVISSIQKIALYETKSRLYVIASNNSENKFRVLKIDRLDPRELTVIDDKVEYSRDDVRVLISMIDTGNRGRGGGALRPDVSAFGIVGFVRFTEGYYMIVVTARRKVAVVGLHSVYKIQDTAMVYLPHESVRIPHPDEPRYLKMFQSIDLSSNFYFSYGYDITNTLQVNMAVPRNLGHLQHPCDPQAYNFDKGSTERADNEELFPSTVNKENAKKSDGGSGEQSSVVHHYGVRSEPNRRFVWNGYLLSEVEGVFHPDWILYVMHGFVSQSNVSVLGRSVYIALIARRSSKYAGTRFLKRGANFDGDVANEVETEQLVEDIGVSSVDCPRLTAFVQMRGSIPAHWSQDIGKMVPKPPIAFDLSDAFAQTAGAHFNSLLGRYGSPVIILNLVKEREKKRHESQLSGEYTSAVAYLNQFLPPDHRIQYVHFDMARMNKGKGANVMGGLADIARLAVTRTGLYSSYRPYDGQQPATVVGLATADATGRSQTGVIRVNCVDCLDRTNTAQFALGKCALAFQLCSLGLLSRPCLDFDSDCVRLLEVLYEDHGDTLALQYGGSQLVHRIKTYRKTAPWTSQGNDIMQTLSRYYSNTFSDTEKQHAMNLFLGLFVPGRPQHSGPIWDQITDYYLHNTIRKLHINRPMTQWWDERVMSCLPLSTAQCHRAVQSFTRVLTSRDIESVDAYADFHRPHEFSELAETYANKISHSVRDFMPHCVTDHSPFTVRVRPGRRREETARGANPTKNPSLTGHSSTASTDSSDESEWEELTDGTLEGSQQVSPSRDLASPHPNHLSPFPPLDTLFPTFPQTYGAPLHPPSRQDMHTYKRYVLMYRAAGLPVGGGGGEEPPAPSSPTCPLPLDSSRETRPPRVTARSTLVYQQFVERAEGVVTPLDAAKYEAYVRCELGIFPPTPWER